MRLRSDGEQTREKILKAACSAFGEKGYHKATFAQMGRLGGFNPALISFHFRSKDDLYRAAWLTLLTQANERWPVHGNLPADAPAEERLRAHIEASLNRSCDPELAGLHRIQMQEQVNATGLLDNEVQEYFQENQRHMRTLLADLLGDGATDADIELCEMSIINQFAILRPPGRSENENEDRKPVVRFSRDDIDLLINHIACFSLGGVAAVRLTITANKGCGDA